MTFDELMELESTIKNFDFGFDEELKRFKVIKKQHESLKKLFVAIMNKTWIKSDKKMLISKAKYKSEFYKSLNFTFEEGDNFWNYLKAKISIFKSIYKEVNDIISSKSCINWKQYLELENRLKELPFDFENEETQTLRNLGYLEKVAIIQSYKDFMKSKINNPEQENESNTEKKSLCSTLWKPLISAKKEAEQIANAEKIPYTPQELLIPYSKIIGYIIDLKRKKYQREDEVKEKEEYKMDIDSDEHSAYEWNKSLSKPLTNLEGLSDNEIIHEIDKYRSTIQNEIQTWTSYIQLKDLESTLKLKSFIDFQDVIKPKKKELKKEYLKLKKQEHKAKLDKEEEELKKSLDPDKYNQLVRDREWKKSKKSRKTDWTIEKGDDEEWDQRNLTFADPDDKMELDDLVDSQPTSKPKKSKNEKKAEKPKEKKEKVEKLKKEPKPKQPKESKPKPEKVLKQKTDKVSKPKAEKEQKKKVVKDLKASKDKKRDDKASKKEKEQEKEAIEAKQKQNKEKWNEALDRIKQRLWAKKEGDGKPDILKDLIKDKAEPSVVKDLSTSVKEALAKARGEKIQPDPPKEDPKITKVEEEPSNLDSKEPLDNSSNKEIQNHSQESVKKEAPKKSKKGKTNIETTKPQKKTKSTKSDKPVVEEKSEKDSKKVNKKKETKKAKKAEENEELKDTKETKVNKKKVKSKEIEQEQGQGQEAAKEYKEVEPTADDEEIKNKESTKIKLKPINNKLKKSAVVKRMKISEEEEKPAEQPQSDSEDQPKDSSLIDSESKILENDLPMIDWKEENSSEETKTETKENDEEEPQNIKEEKEQKNTTRKSLFSRLSINKMKPTMTNNKFSMKKNTLNITNRKENEDKNNRWSDNEDENTEETSKENTKQNSQKENSSSDKEIKEKSHPKQMQINAPVAKKYTLKKNPGKPSGLAASLNKLK